MKVLKTIWRFLNGNKTIIGSGLLLLSRLTFFKANVSPDIFAITEWTGGILATGGLAHHIYKGYFTTKVGNEGQEIKDPLKNINVQK